MDLYPVHRQIFPSTDAMAFFSVGSSPLRQNPDNETTKPGVQNPHCVADSSCMACCTTLSLLMFRPSTVTTCLPMIFANGVRQEVNELYASFSFLIFPTNTVHAPQSPSLHPVFVPFRC